MRMKKEKRRDSAPGEMNARKSKKMVEPRRADSLRSMGRERRIQGGDAGWLKRRDLASRFTIVSAKNPRRLKMLGKAFVDGGVVCCFAARDFEKARENAERRPDVEKS